MIFSSTTTHALRALSLLAAREGAGPVQGRDLAAQAGVPADYLAKVLAQLSRAGVLSAVRGAKGGYRLARPAGRIRLAEVVLPLEGKRARPGCLLRPERACRDSGACSAHGSWGAVKEAYTAFLEQTTLADISERHPDLAAPPPRVRPAPAVRRGG